ncbi:MAG: UDP-N-acetylmuramoyl-tripeptide--D-alanyl-D-alanine ligase [Candidatus Aminicenantales bacterium]|jgi:UDP-N-acetylmuramoyl-tripeptide--D-alanyl-D-alanine ligase
MAELRADWIAERAGGVLVQGSAERRFRSFTIDSRQTGAGDLFFAIVSSRDGHAYVADAAAKGARGAVVSRPMEGLPPDFVLIRTDDTVRALQALGRAVLHIRLRRVIGITGSVGKTTTKDFTARILAGRYNVLKSEGNFNNHLGLSLSLLRLETDHTAAVLEMGMSAPGEIRALTAIAPPDVAVITNVNPAHLETLGTIEAVAGAKWEIVAGLKPGGTAVLNGDDAALRAVSAGWNGHILRFGPGDGCDVRAVAVERCGFEGFTFDLQAGGRTARTRLRFLTEGYLYDALAAAAVAFALNAPLSDIAAAIADLRPAPKRGDWKILGQGVVLIDDSYNSNPKALETALRGLGTLPAGRRVAVLGDMLELGPEEARFHAEAGRTAAGSGWDVIMTVGPLARGLAEAARAAGLEADRITTFETSEEAAAALPAMLRPGDLVLVKGSRGVRTEIVVEAIETLFKEN